MRFALKVTKVGFPKVIFNQDTAGLFQLLILLADNLRSLDTALFRAAHHKIRRRIKSILLFLH